MIKGRVEYIETSIMIANLSAMETSSLIKQAGVLDSVYGKIKEYVFSKYDKDRPVASVVGFIGPALLWRLGFPWVSVLYEVMEALGFNWTDFWSNIGNSIGQLVSGVSSGSSSHIEPSEVQSIVSAEMDKSFSGNINVNKLKEVAKRQLATESTLNVLRQNKYGQEILLSLEIIKKEAQMGRLGLLGLIYGAGRFFKKIISWLLISSLTAVGFAVAGGVASDLLGTKKSPSKETSRQDEEGTSQVAYTPSSLIPKNIDPDLTKRYPNDLYNVWIEPGNIREIDETLLEWAIKAYPQLSEHKDDVRRSSNFLKMIQLFESRNRLAQNLNIISIPKPYERKIDIVNIFALPFLMKSKYQYAANR